MPRKAIIHATSPVLELVKIEVSVEGGMWDKAIEMLQDFKANNIKMPKFLVMGEQDFLQLVGEAELDGKDVRDLARWGISVVLVKGAEMHVRGDWEYELNNLILELHDGGID